MTRNQEIIENKLRETGRKGTSELLFKMNKLGYYSAKCSGYLFHSTLDSVAPSAYSRDVLLSGISKMKAFKQDIRLGEVQFIRRSDHKVLIRKQWGSV